MSQTKIAALKQNQCGSVMIISLLLISTVLGCAALSVDLSGHLLANSKAKLISDVSSLVGAAHVGNGAIDSLAESAAEQVAAVNLSNTKAISWDSQINFSTAEVTRHLEKATVTVSTNHNLNPAFSKILGIAPSTKLISNSAAVIDKGNVSIDAPLHVLLLTDASAMINCTNLPFVQCVKDTGKNFSLQILETLGENDYLTWITYASVARVVLKKLRMDAAGKALATIELNKLDMGYFGAGYEAIGPTLSRIYADPTSAIAAARAVLLESPAYNEREAIIFPSDAAFWDKDIIIGYWEEVRETVFYNFGHIAVTLNSNDGWYWAGVAESNDIKQNCGYVPNSTIYVSEMTHLDFGIEYVSKVIEGLQNDRDLRAYTVAMREINPLTLESGYDITPDSYAYAHNVQIEIADDPNFAYSFVPFRIQCSRNRPVQKRGRYFPYSDDQSKIANELIYHARFAPFSGPTDQFHFKPSLVAN